MSDPIPSKEQIPVSLAQCEMIQAINQTNHTAVMGAIGELATALTGSADGKTKGINHSIDIIQLEQASMKESIGEVKEDMTTVKESVGLVAPKSGKKTAMIITASSLGGGAGIYGLIIGVIKLFEILGTNS